MKLTRTSIVLASLCVGLLAALLTYQYLAREQARTNRLTQELPVVVTTKPIAARTIIEPSAVTVISMEAGKMPADSISSLDEVVGQVSLSYLSENEPVTRSAVARRTAALGLAYSVPVGQRAVAVALDPIIGVAGFLMPGDRVDVVATFTVDKLKVTKTVLQDVTLLSIGVEVSPEEGKGAAADKAARPKEQPNATLAVTPEQAEKLILAEAWGKLRLTLRPADDRAIVSLTGIRSDVLIGTRPPAAARTYTAPTPRQGSPVPSVSRVPARPSQPPTRPVSRTPRASDGFSVETIRGTQKTTIEVNEN
jgi:pilus assembly protein CpaB